MVNLAHLTGLNMVPVSRISDLVGFGEFEVDLATGELYENGQKVRLSGQPMEVLRFLIRRAGSLVRREELRSALWPADTFVDFDHGLNSCIQRIRQTLRDSVGSPRYVETLPKQGYRFIGELQAPLPQTFPSVGIEPALGPHRRHVWWKIGAGILATSIIALAALIAYRWYRPQEQVVLTAVPFTALPRWATSPAFSPDGSRIAFAWNGDPKGNVGAEGFDLYVKSSGSETLLRLTQHPSEWVSPAWSPDGTKIAFHRLAGAESGVYVVPALGGPERKLRSTRIPWEDFPAISWSPDGKWIAFSDWLPADDHTGIHLLSPETGETERIPNGAKCIGQVQPAFSHNGKYLAYWCYQSGNVAALYFLPLQGSEPKMVSLLRDWPTGLTWSADDKELIYSLWGDSGHLGEITVANGSVKTLTLAVSANQPTVSSRGDKLAYSSVSYIPNIWRKDLLHAESPALALIPSSRAQFDVQYSPDGKRIAFASMRSGVQGVWIANEDGSSLVQISNPAQPSGNPQWSPDGTKIGFDSLSRDGWEIYLADVAERIPRKLVTNVSGGVRPHWSRDGEWIYFSSEEPGRMMGVYRCPASGGDASVLSKDVDGISPQESFDRKTIYFASHEQKSTLKKVAVRGQPGPESEVEGLPRLSNSSLWTLSPGGIYFVPADAPRSLHYFDFASKQVRPIFEADKDFSSGLSVSPDGRWILYSLLADPSGDILLIDHFR